MTSELKQRLIGAVVITAIAAIFIPMLFEDPIKESTQAVNELTIPEPPQIASPEDASAGAVTDDYPMESADAVEGQDASGFDSNAEPVEAMATEESASIEAADDKKAAEKMRLEDMAALKDKKEREKILHESAVEEDVVVSSALQDEELSDKQSKEKREADRKASDKLEADRRAKDKLLLDKKTVDKLAKEQIEYRKLADKKNQEKILADKLAVEKLAAEAKVAAKQQVLDDKAAVAKIAADKIAAEKAAANTPAMVRWYIRVGSFSQEANALSLRDNLRKQGYPAVVDVIKSAEKGLLYRLRVGPELSKVQAEKSRQKMDAENNSKSILELE